MPMGIRPALYNENSLRIKRNLPVDHIRHVAAWTEELHHRLARSHHFCPSRFCFRILLQPSDFISLEHEVHFTKFPLLRLSNRAIRAAQVDDVDILDADLPPDIDERIFKEFLMEPAFIFISCHHQDLSLEPRVCAPGGGFNVIGVLSSRRIAARGHGSMAARNGPSSPGKRPFSRPGNG